MRLLLKSVSALLRLPTAVLIVVFCIVFAGPSLRALSSTPLLTDVSFMVESNAPFPDAWEAVVELMSVGLAATFAIFFVAYLRGPSQAEHPFETAAAKWLTEAAFRRLYMTVCLAFCLCIAFSLTSRTYLSVVVFAVAASAVCLVARRWQPAHFAVEVEGIAYDSPGLFRVLASLCLGALPLIVFAGPVVSGARTVQWLAPLELRLEEFLPGLSETVLSLGLAVPLSLALTFLPGLVEVRRNVNKAALSLKLLKRPTARLQRATAVALAAGVVGVLRCEHWASCSVCFVLVLVGVGGSAIAWPTPKVHAVTPVTV